PVLVDQGAALGERGAGVMHPVGRRRRHLVDRHDRGGGEITRPVQPAVAVVEHHQDRGQREVGDQAQRARGRVREDRRGFLLRKRHGGTGRAKRDCSVTTKEMERLLGVPFPGFARQRGTGLSSPFLRKGGAKRTRAQRERGMALASCGHIPRACGAIPLPVEGGERLALLPSSGSRPHSLAKKSLPCMSISSSARPPPRATQVSGSSAICTYRPVSSLISLSITRSSAPPPVSTMPRSCTSEHNSGDLCSSPAFTAATMPCSGSCRASSTSLQLM